MKNDKWLFGYGTYGKKYIEKFGVENVKGFIDNNSSKISRYVNSNQKSGVPLLNFTDFEKKYNNEIIVICMSNASSVLAQLLKADIDLSNIRYFDGKNVLPIECYTDRDINSQCGEDIGVRHYFSCKYGDYKGTFCDVGAYDPFIGNNTKWAYNRGWKGLNIDASAETVDMFKILRPSDINLNYGVSDSTGIMKYYMCEDSGRNSFDKSTIEQGNIIEERDVQVKTLNDILAEVAIEKIDFLDIDIEGFDEKVVMSFNWKKYRPEVVLIEQLGCGCVENVIRSNIYRKMISEGYKLYGWYSVTAMYVNPEFHS